MTTVYLSLGSNVGDREANLRSAVERLEARRVSPIYETEPVDYTAQPYFLNMVVETATGLMPLEYLALTQGIERDIGRTPGIPKGPRVIDIDLLLFDTQLIHTPTLEVPHPRLRDRRFVLAPLADVAPELRHPVTGQTVREMLNALPLRETVQRWKPLPQ